MDLPKNHEIRITGPGSFDRGMDEFLADHEGAVIVGHDAAPLNGFATATAGQLETDQE